MNLNEKQKIAHLLRRFGLGASEQELEYYGKDGLKGAINLLLNYEKNPDVTNFDPMEFANKQGTVNLRVMKTLHYMRILGTQRPLEEKMTLFWHNHFATSDQKVENAFVMNEHMNVLRRNATGNFKSLLTEISKNPAMIYWLDNQENVAGKPNENFAREVMELFTLGVDNGYTEKDVQEAARAFTGWRYGRGRLTNNKTPRRIDTFIFDQKLHDSTPKTLFGQSGRFKGEDVLEMLCDNKQTAKYIAQKAWSWFAYENGEEAVIQRVADKFYDSGLEIKSLIRAIMEAPEFYSEKSYRKLIKNPIDFAIVTARQLGIGQQVVNRLTYGIENKNIDSDNGININLVRGLAPCFALVQSTTSMGMELMSPPDVSGWRTGPYWITSATMVERVKWAERLFAGGSGGTRNNLGANVGGGQGGPSVGFNAWDLVQDNPTPVGLVTILLSVFDVELPSAKKQILLDAAARLSDGRLTAQNVNTVARTITKSIFATPEFQLA